MSQADGSWNASIDAEVAFWAARRCAPTAWGHILAMQPLPGTSSYEIAAKLHLALLWRRPELLIDSKWPDVLAVARALMERTTLKVVDVANVIRCCG